MWKELPSSSLWQTRAQYRPNQPNLEILAWFPKKEWSFTIGVITWSLESARHRAVFPPAARHYSPGLCPQFVRLLLVVVCDDLNPESHAAIRTMYVEAVFSPDNSNQAMCLFKITKFIEICPLLSEICCPAYR
jgi:hypothetical protein